MKKYISENTKQMRKSTRIVGIIASLLLIFLGITVPSFYTGLVGIIILFAIILQKTTFVNEDGICTLYDMILYNRTQVWRFDEIKEIHKDPSPNGDKMALHVMKDVMSRRLVFTPDVAREVIELALEQNPDIHIAYVDK